jgi:hypothetical protein
MFHLTRSLSKIAKSKFAFIQMAHNGYTKVRNAGQVDCIYYMMILAEDSVVAEQGSNPTKPHN